MLLPLPADVDENNNAQVTGLYNLLDQTAERQGCAIVVVHHASKGNQKNKSVADVGSGAGAQSRAVDCHLVLRPHEDKACVVMDAIVRDGPPVDPVVLVREFPLWRIDTTKNPAAIRGDKPTRPKVTLDEFVAACVTQQPQDYRLVVQTARDRFDISKVDADLLLVAAVDAGIAVEYRPQQRNKPRTVCLPKSKPHKQAA